jgi:hypothetical protein
MSGMQSKKDDNQDEDNNSHRELHWGPTLGSGVSLWLCQCQGAPRHTTQQW